jgi:general secretion pathway protein H
MTLMEVMVAIAIVGLIAVGMTAAVGGIFGARLDASANKLSGMVRYTYNRATLSGKVHRIVIDLEAGTYKVEQVEESKECGMKTAEEEKESRRQDEKPEDFIAKLTGTVVENSRVKVEKLALGISFAGVMTRHNSSIVEEGSEAVYFFPDGTAERAYVWLTDGDEVFTVEVTSLQGTGIVHDEEVDAKELMKR